MAKNKPLTDAERRQMVEQDRKNWAPDSDQDDRTTVVEDWVANGNDIQPDK